MIKPIELNENKLILLQIDSRTGEVSDTAVIVDYVKFPEVSMYITMVRDKEN